VITLSNFHCTLKNEEKHVCFIQLLLHKIKNEKSFSWLEELYTQKEGHKEKEIKIQRQVILLLTNNHIIFTIENVCIE
jgi:hypothetical protein